MNTNKVITLNSRDTTTSADSSVWLNLEQEYIPFNNTETSLEDLRQMIAYVQSGQSALAYVMSYCKYLTFQQYQVTVTLKFYVWPSDMSLPYTLRADFGEISEGAAIEKEKSVDVIFNGSTESIMNQLFEGSGTPSMPFFLEDGSESIPPAITFENGRAFIDTLGYCVYRADGIARGYEHELTMTFDKLVRVTETFNIINSQSKVLSKKVAAGSLEWEWGDDLVNHDYPGSDTEVTLDYGDHRVSWLGVSSGTLTVSYNTFDLQSITNISNNLFAEWVDADGELQTTALAVEIPKCVGDSLSVCDDSLKADWIMCGGLYGCDGSQEYRVYYNTCTGEIIGEWYSKKS